MIYRIVGFDEGPHWCEAIVRATSPEEATAILRAKIGSEDDWPETVWGPRPVSEWEVREVPDHEVVISLLGAGCR